MLHIQSYFLTVCLFRWQGVDGRYSKGFGQVSHVEQIAPVLTRVLSRSSGHVKRYKQDERFVVFSPPSSLRLRVFCVTGRQDWLSPPDPSMNHNFVREKQHPGTATWVFESNSFIEWKARGSFLWIHGKRMYFERLTSAIPVLIAC